MPEVHNIQERITAAGSSEDWRVWLTKRLNHAGFTDIREDHQKFHADYRDRTQNGRVVITLQEINATRTLLHISTTASRAHRFATATSSCRGLSMTVRAALTQNDLR